MARRDVLKQFCHVGCGHHINDSLSMTNRLEPIDWGLACDTLHFLSVDIRSFHRCHRVNTDRGCKAAVKRSYEICR